MSSEVAIKVSNVSKHYLMYDKPEDRLKQMIVPKIYRVFGNKVKQYYKHFSAVNDVSLDVFRGETIGIVGRNGSGKSTLLQMICNTLQPTAGEIAVNGRVAALLELGSGFNPEFTGRENVYLNAAILGLEREETEARFDQIADFAGIGVFIDQPVKTYSSGMYVRLAFAVATNVDPDILIVDEALSVGDEAFQRKCFARIEQIKERGGTILFVSHGAQTITQLCDRAVLMDRGENILLGDPKTVIKQYQRLLALQGDEAEAARNEIKQTGTTDQLEKAANSQPEDTLEMLIDEAWFDPSLKSESAVEYGGDVAVISDVHITRMNGKRVNVLTKNITYALRYSVSFNKPAERVGFGTLIKTINGIELGGVGTNLRDDYVDIACAGNRVLVEMKFKCALQAGTYFCNAGVSVDMPDGMDYLHRILDAVCFRVVGDAASDFSGFVDFGIGHSVELKDVTAGGDRRVAY